MTIAAQELRASYAFVERNINLTRRYWGWEVVWLLYTIANSLAVVFIAQSVNAAVGSTALSSADVDKVILFLAIGALVWHYISVVFETVSDMISWERWEGTIEYTFMAPVRRTTHMVGTSLFSLVYGLIHTAVVLLVIVLVFHLNMGHADYLAATLVLLMGSLSLIGIGIMGAVLPLLYPERGSQMCHVVQALLVLISGVYIQADQMPAPLAALSVLSPARYIIEGIRSALIDGDSVVDLWKTLLGLFLCGIVFIPLGVWVFSLGERYAKRAGKLKRTG